MKIVTACFLAIAMALISSAAEKDKTPTWIDPEMASREAPAFNLQGEYTGQLDGKDIGLQAAALPDGDFLVLNYQGGLPNEGWDGGKLESKVLASDALKELIRPLKRVERTSPTLGQEAPDGALVLFDGKPNDLIEGTVEDGLLWAGASTTKPLRDFRLHLEFRLPFKPGRMPSSQDRGNSGVYLFNNYEIQVIDSFGLDFDKENNAIDLQSDSKQWCGCFYKFRQPDVPMCFPPLTWQTYDIDFTAPRFEGDKKVANARITVRHNGVVIHDDVEMEKGTGAGGKRPEKPEGLIHFQGHGNPVAFRNIWLIGG